MHLGLRTSSSDDMHSALGTGRCKKIMVHSVSVDIPEVLCDLFEFIEIKQQQGIFRINGSVKRINQYYNDLDNYKTWLSSANVFDICGLVKKILSQKYNDMFSTSSVEEIKKLYLQYKCYEASGAERRESWDRRRSSNGSSSDEMSLASFKTANSNLSNSHLVWFLQKFSTLLLTRNTMAKNGVFIYLLETINKLLTYKDVTKMTSQNMSIVFQPYIFSTLNLEDLKVLQEALEFLIVNCVLLVHEFYLALESDNGSMTSLESPIEDLSLKDLDSTKPGAFRRFSSFMDVHSSSSRRLASTDISRSRESLMRSRESITKIASERDSAKEAALMTKRTPERHSLASIPTENTSKSSSRRPSYATSRSKESVVHESPSKLFKSLAGYTMGSRNSIAIDSIPEDIGKSAGFSNLQKSGKRNRKSFIGFFRHSSNDSNESFYNNLNNSVDNILVNKRNSMIEKKNEPLVRRSFSIKLKSKKY